MNTYKINAKVAGILFILGTAAPIAGGLLTKSIMDSADYLKQMSAHPSLITFLIFMQFLMGVACAGISIAFYPMLKKFSQGLALGAVGFRLLEGGLGVLVAASTFGLLTLSRGLAASAAPASSFYLVAASLVRTVSDWIGNGPLLICWIIGAALYYTLFYQYRLIPRWLTLWGLIGITLTFVASVLVMIDPKFGSLQSMVSMPILVQEMVMAVWMIVKGFSLPKN
jgi:hypothetical protein